MSGADKTYPNSINKDIFDLNTSPAQGSLKRFVDEGLRDKQLNRLRRKFPRRILFDPDHRGRTSRL